MLVPYGYFEVEKRLLRKLNEALAMRQCIYRASDLMHALTYRNVHEFGAVVEKAKNASFGLRIPLGYHFKSIYISRPEGLYREYRLSRFACYLITVNADSSYPAVARAHVLLVIRH